MTDSRVTPQAEAAWRLSIQACTEAGGVPLGSFNWPWALGLALDEVERLRLLCQPLQDEIDRLRAIVEAVEKLATDPVHICDDVCAEWGCDDKGTVYFVLSSKLRAALAAVPVGTE